MRACGSAGPLFLEFFHVSENAVFLFICDFANVAQVLAFVIDLYNSTWPTSKVRRCARLRQRVVKPLIQLASHWRNQFLQQESFRISSKAIVVWFWYDFQRILNDFVMIALESPLVYL